MPAALVARVGNCRELVRPREARAEITGDVAAATHPCPFINVQRQRVSAVDSGESAGIVPSLQHAGKRQPLPKGLLDSLNMAEALV